MDSVSRVQCSPEEIHKARPEKGEHKRREIHTPRKAGDPNLVNNSRDASSQDKTESSKSENEQRAQKILRGKAEHRETAECSRQRKPTKRCIPSKAPSTQTSDGEGKGHREASGGPTFVGPTSTEKGIGFTRGDKAHLIRETSVQGMLAPRENRRKMQQLSQLRFYTLPRNRKKLSMMRGGRRIPAKKNKKGRGGTLDRLGAFTIGVGAGQSSGAVFAVPFWLQHVSDGVWAELQGVVVWRESLFRNRWLDNRPPSGAIKSTCGGRAICFSACHDVQMAADTSAPSKKGMNGAMTHCFIQAIESNPGLTYYELLTTMHENITQAYAARSLGAQIMYKL
ncbi:hypothetical protein Ancab_017493 [Ancistrocladus abbreviatus]